VIEPLRKLLAELREAESNPASGPILRGMKGKPLNLNMLAKRVIRPALRNPENYRTPDAKPIEWQGFYSLRRGIATQLTAIRWQLKGCCDIPASIRLSRTTSRMCRK
jgi:hypothetical protein